MATTITVNHVLDDSQLEGLDARAAQLKLSREDTLKTVIENRTRGFAQPLERERQLIRIAKLAKVDAATLAKVDAIELTAEETPGRGGRPGRVNP